MVFKDAAGNNDIEDFEMLSEDEMFSDCRFHIPVQLPPHLLLDSSRAYSYASSTEPESNDEKTDDDDEKTATPRREGSSASKSPRRPRPVGRSFWSKRDNDVVDGASVRPCKKGRKSGAWHSKLSKLEAGGTAYTVNDDSSDPDSEVASCEGWVLGVTET